LLWSAAAAAAHMSTDDDGDDEKTLQQRQVHMQPLSARYIYTGPTSLNCNTAA